jgi:tRNA 2-thiouridine synthesizing protein D
MRYSLLVLSNPASGHSNRSAAAFARALLARGHDIFRVFFLDEGARTGNALAVSPQDEHDPVADWQALQREAGLELVLCVSSALRRGILDADEAQRYERGAASMAPGFEIGGLGALIEACAHSDRLVTFGG